ncbi:MAG: translation initiation factor IF-6 [Infirmifilum sp.]
MSTVELAEIYGTSQVGVFIFTNDEYALIPVDVPSKLEDKIMETLKVEVHKTTMVGSRLLGVLIAGNNSGVVLPYSALEGEIQLIKSLGLNVAVLDDVKLTGLGNLILANDKGCLVSPLLPQNAVNTISEVLNVECIVGGVGGSPFAGSLGVVTNRGLALPPFVSDDDMKDLESLFKVQAGLLTVNKGRMFLRSGLVANSKGAIAGVDTTGYELMQIQRILFPT